MIRFQCLGNTLRSKIVEAVPTLNMFLCSQHFVGSIQSYIIACWHFLKNIFIDSLEKEKESMSSEEEQREKQIPRWAKSPVQGSIPGPWDHDLTWRQMLNWLSHPGTHKIVILRVLFLLLMWMIQSNSVNHTYPKSSSLILPGLIIQWNQDVPLWCWKNVWEPFWASLFLLSSLSYSALQMWQFGSV